MFKKLLELIKQALRKMVQYGSITDVITDRNIYTVSEDMQSAFDLWEKMYEDKSPWLDNHTGVYSLGIAPFICSDLASQITNEFKSSVLDPGQEVKDVDISAESDITSRASYINNTYNRHLIPDLRDKLEHALAVGGMIVKPYISNGEIYYNFCMQGEFVPLGFTDDGIMYDVAFYDDFVEGNKRYRRVERHTWDEQTKINTITNTAYVVDITDIKDKGIELGNPISLQDIPRWSSISDEPVQIQDVEKPLFGYYKVAKSNNVDTSSPLGISVFSRAASLIKRADIQFSRLDWEYEAGQIAVDVDASAMNGLAMDGPNVDQLRNRLYRKIDLGTDSTYNVFAPSLRDTQYHLGLNTYLMRIEDLCEISRGTISEVQSEARTATELKILQQRSYKTLIVNQQALEKCLDDVIYATNVLIDLYELYPDGEYTTVHEWNDSILQDTDAELAQRLQLVQAEILSKAELRAWYCGEDIETAKAAIEEIQNSKNLLNDIFSTPNGEQVEPSSLESEEEQPEDTEEEDNKEPKE